MSGLTQVTSDVISTNTISGLISAGFTSMNVATFGTQTIEFGSSNTLVFQANTSAERMRVSNTGFLGIGTSNPIRRFHVSGSGTVARFESSSTTNATVTEILLPTFTAGQFARFAWRANTPGTIFSGIETYYQNLTTGSETADIAFSTINGGAGLTEKLRITANGNIGIGTTSPYTPLDVNGYSSFGVRNTTAYTTTTSTHYFGSSPADLIRNNIVFNINTDATTSSRLRFYKSRGSSASPTTVNSGDLLGDIQFAGHDGTSYVYSGGMSMSVTATPSTNSLSTALVFLTNSATNTGTEKMRIDSSGNVGIGSTSPQAILDLGSGTSGRALTWGGPTGSARYASIFAPYSNSGIVLGVGFYGSTSADSYLSSFTGTYYSSGIRINYNSADGIQFFTDGSASKTAGAAFTPTERMRIDSSGNVGIGTASPSYALDVRSAAAPAIRLSRSGSAGQIASVVFEDGTATLGTGNTTRIASDSGAMSFSTGGTSGAVTGGTERMRITAGGVLCVGGSSSIGSGTGGISSTVSSSYNISLEKPTGGAIGFYQSGVNTSAIEDVSSQGGLRFYTGTGGSITERMRILPGAAILCLSGGNTSATGTGIAFPATQNASSDANTLDDYEEGTWTPIATSQTGSITSYASNGSYIKIGRTVFIRVEIALTNVGSAGGWLSVSGLPFTTASGQRPFVALARENAATGNSFQVFGEASDTYFRVTALTNVGAITWTNGYGYVLTATYPSAN